MAEEDSKKASAKKKTLAPKAPAKKKAIAKVDELAITKPIKIFEDPKFTKPAHSTDRDIVKILARNPLEAFVFWKVHPEHFDQLVKDFSAGHTSEIQLKLKLEYINHAGKPETSWYDLAPMTKSYFCKFPGPVSQMRAYLYANHFGNLKLFLETGDGDLPPGIESYQLDGDWIHPKWIEDGLVVQSKKGEWLFSDSMDHTERVWNDLENQKLSYNGSSNPSSHSSSKATRK
ncbi:MAG: hypothetical protein SH817_06230 [Leptospira sp.]|nr:hypothetical protein [Leptospira sp.]